MDIKAESELKAYWLKDPIWYAPQSVMHHYAAHLDILPAEQKNTKAFRKADELLVASIALLGIQLDESVLYWMQLVSDDEESPDVRTGRFLDPVGENAPHFSYQDVEMVSFIPEPGEDIASFLSRTKLSKDKAYDAKTVVLCHINKATHVPSLSKITEALKGTGAICPVIILGRTHPERKDYTLFQVHPQFKNIAEYNLDEVLKNQPRRSVLNLKRGTKPLNISRPNDEHCPFESIGFECPLIQKH
jgi:hypothetical protein